MRFYFFVFSLLLFQVEKAYGQHGSFQHYSVEEGLSNRSVFTISQDKKGFIWFGTSDGLCRFDGIRFKVFKNSVDDVSGISSSHINKVFTDSKGVVWVGTPTGLNRYDEERDIFENIIFKGRTLAKVSSIYEDSGGFLWIGASGSLYKVSEKGEIDSLSVAVGHTIRDVFEDQSKRIWVVSNLGLHHVFKHGIQYNVKKHGTFKNDNLTSISQDVSGLLWLGTSNNGVFSYDINLGRVKHYTTTQGLASNNVRCITIDKKHRLWVGTLEGISVFTPSTNTFENIVHVPTDSESLSQNSVYSIFQDSVGSIWVGTYHGGANVSYAFDSGFNKLQDKTNRTALSSQVISSILGDEKQNLWIGTEGGGVNFYNTITQSFVQYKHNPTVASSLSTNLVKVLHQDTDNNLWVGTHAGGLNVLPMNGNGFKKYSLTNPKVNGEEISSIVDDSRGNLWVAANTGLFIFKRNGVELSRVSGLKIPFKDVARVLFKDSKKNIWLTGSVGVTLVKGSTNKGIEVDTSLIVNCFSESESGDIWVGTVNRGLAKFNGKKFILYTNSFFDTAEIMGVLCGDENDLWVSTSKGLVHYYPESGTYKVYTTKDGLTGTDFNYNACFKATNGNYYFGGYNGLSYFNPEKIRNNLDKAPLVLTSLRYYSGKQIHEKSIVVETEVIFKHNQNTFTVDFALLNYIKSEKNIYQYKLEDYDLTWQETSNGSATYTNLPPGTYLLHIKGANNDRVWSDEKVFKIVVKPPFWLTWWAYCFYIILLGGMVFIGARFFFLRALLKKEDELLQTKIDFFTNASHEIRTHLTLIMIPVERLLNEVSNTSFVSNQLAQVKANANRLLNLVNELLDFRKAEASHLQLSPQVQNLVPFLEEICHNFKETAQVAQVKLDFEHSENEILANFDERQFEKVFFNLITNAIKFTPKGGNVKVSVDNSNNEVIIRVVDNGRGIAPQFLPRLFINFFQVADYGVQNTGYGIGLALAKSITELHKGSISVESTPAQNGLNGKTTFTVVIPQNALIEGLSRTESVTRLENNLNITKDLPTEVELNVVKNKSVVLVVEDNEYLREMMVAMLLPTCHVLTAQNGLLGWEMAISEIPDLIVSDVMMPEMDGFQLCEKLKSDDRTSHIPVILLTAKSSQNEQLEGLQLGADIYLTKPFNTKVLSLSIRNLLVSRNRIKQKATKELAFFNLLASKEVHTSEPNSEQAFLEKVSSIVEENLEDTNFGVDKLAKEVAMSVPVLYKKIRATTDMSVNEFIKVHRFKKAAELLSLKQLNVNEVAGAVGFDDRKYFSREFKKYFGVVPSDFTAKSAEMNLNA